MNWNIVEQSWKQFKGKVETQRAKLVGDQIDVIAGKRVELPGKIEDASLKGNCIAEEEILSRRVVLRGALAAGCGLLLPSLFAGCDSKKGSYSSSSAPANSPTPGTASAAPGKVSQASVKYQTHPNGEQKCSGCMNFIPESNTCKLVEGQISPDGWCTLWIKKA